MKNEDRGGTAGAHLQNTACDERTKVHVAVVHGACEVHFLVAGECPLSLSKKLCDRLAQVASAQLWEEQAQTFCELRRAGRVEQAIEFYFSAVGDRWDPAWLSVHTVYL